MFITCQLWSIITITLWYRAMKSQSSSHLTPGCPCWPGSCYCHSNTDVTFVLLLLHLCQAWCSKDSSMSLLIWILTLATLSLMWHLSCNFYTCFRRSFYLNSGCPCQPGSLLLQLYPWSDIFLVTSTPISDSVLIRQMVHVYWSYKWNNRQLPTESPPDNWLP